MTDVPEAAKVRLPPPLVFLGCVALGAVLEGQNPLPVSLERGPIGYGAAAVCLLLSAYFLKAAVNHFKRTRQDPKPWKPSPELIAEGIYRWTRNPMYVGMGLFQLSLGFAFGHLWTVLLVPVAELVVYLTAIRHEEAYLEAKFGDSYREYKRTVGRFFGRRA